FFQAEDGIRDFHVTGVQTCALPISASGAALRARFTTTRQRAQANAFSSRSSASLSCPTTARNACISFLTCAVCLSSCSNIGSRRSEERRVGKECGVGGRAEHEYKIG